MLIKLKCDIFIGCISQMVTFSATDLSKHFIGHAELRQMNSAVMSVECH